LYERLSGEFVGIYRRNRRSFARLNRNRDGDRPQTPLPATSARIK